jgi:uncharacterized protein DUF6220
VRRQAIPFAVVAWLFLAGVVLQVFLAGMGLFNLSDFKAHDGFGWLLASVPLFVLLPLAVVTGLERLTVWLTLILVIATAFQPELALARKTDPVLAALHPVNAMLIFAVALFLARRSLVELRRVEPGTPERPKTPAERPASEVSRVDPGR